ncbi:MAG TPA: hypothetical protein VMH40_07890 [Myxococcaceae bacterium]|nr:hypothetical protein [Myxococcaceae bacterium]
MTVPARRQSTPEVAAWAWMRAYRNELLVFLCSFFALACFSGPRFLRQSAAPHFVYQAKAFLDGRLDLDPETLPNLEDWACVREVAGVKTRCTRPVLPGDRWYVSFPAFPAVVMLPFVAVNGWQLNDTSFGVILGALAITLFYWMARELGRRGELDRSDGEALILAGVLGFGTLLFSCAIRGEVWFLAEVLGVVLTCVYIRAATGGARPVLAGAVWSMATLTRTPLVFTGLYFLLEVLTPGPTGRLEQLREALRAPRAWIGPVLRFAAGAAPLAILAMVFNWVRFGSPADFGHRFLFDNRVNADIDTHGLFSPAYLARNLEAAFLMLPRVRLSPFRLDYDPRGLSLLVTMPWLVLLVFPRTRPRLHWPVWLTVALCALPGLFYQNTGYVQFGFRFSLDYTPYLVLLLGLSGWSFRKPLVQVLVGAAVVVNTWGALAFRGYTELMRRM